MKTKKLLAIILSLALLIGLMPVAGLLTTAAAAEETVDLSEKVIKVDFTEGAENADIDSTKWCLSVYNLNSPEVKNDEDFITEAKTNGAYYTFSFDYYLESATYVDADLDTTSNVSLDWPGGYCNYVSGDKVLQPGYHSFTLTEVRTNTGSNMQTYPSFKNIAEDAVLYVWNLKVTLNGRQITAQTAGTNGVKDVYYYVANTSSAAHTYTTATITNDKTLADYDWDFLPDENGNVKVKTVYVKQDGGSDTNDANDGSTADKAYASLYKAMQVIESSLYLEGEIIIVGTYTNKDKYEMIGGESNYHAPTSFSDTETPSNYVTPVTIRGAEGKSANTLYTGADMWLFGPTTFDDITLQKDTTGSGNFYIHARHNAVHFGRNTAKAGPAYLYGGIENAAFHAQPTAPHELTVNFANSEVYLGNKFSNTSDSRKSARTVPGVNYVQNGGTVNILYIGGIGSGANANNAGMIYTDDVNITVNGGTIGTSSGSTYGMWISRLEIAEGAENDFNDNAVQIIFNNGTKMGGGHFPTAGEVEACHGSLYVLHCAAGGSQLAVTEDAGVYTVADPNWVAVATDANGNEVRSKNGTLTVPAGEYSVTWEKAPDTPVVSSTVYVDDKGSDDNAGTSADKPFATLLKAVQTINAAVAESGETAGFINVVNTLTVTDPYAMTTVKKYTDHTQMHTVPITIQGANGTRSVLSIEPKQYGFFLYGDVTIDNITVNGTSGYKIYCHKYNFAFGPGAVVNNSPDIRIGYFGATNTQKPAVAPTEPTVLTLYDGTYTRVTLGNHATNGSSYSIASQFAGVDYTMHGGNVTQLQIGHITNTDAGTAGNIYTDDVNVTVDGGDITKITLGDTGTKITFRTTFANNALQFILNNGTTLTATLPTAEAVAAMGGVLYVLNADEDVYLTATEQAGVYAVKGSKIAVAKNGDAIVAVSRDGKLTVPAGTYDVEYVDVEPYTYDEENGTITVHENVTVDFAGMPYKEKDGALFKGYVDSKGNPAAATLAAGTVLTAQYVENWNVDTDNDGKGDSFEVINTQLRAQETGKDGTVTKAQALRFIVQLNKSVLENFDTVEYGTVLLPNELLLLEELANGKVYGHGDSMTTLMYKSATVQGVNLYLNGETYIQYTAALTGITEKNYLTAYAARGYMTYTDLNGVARTVYTDNTNASSLNEVAEKLLELEPDDATAKTITEAAKSYAVSQSGSVKLTPTNAAAILYGTQAEKTFSKKVDENGVYTTADGHKVTYTANGENGTVVREIEIDTFGENANGEDTVIAQLTDLHINFANDEDMDNEYTKYSWENRLNMNSWNAAGGEHHTIGWHEKALKYATAISDQVVITGDLMDYYSLGNMQLVERLITEPYSNALMVVGNHDIDSVVYDSNAIDPPVDKEFESNNKAYYDQIQQVWTNKVYYTSKLVGKEVMVIQMDNGRDTFRKEQVPLLADDLALARKNGYTVLLFMHVPFKPTAQELIYGDEEIGNGLNMSAKATQDVYDLITTNGDVVRGIFAGHVHDDIYSTISATYVENGVKKNTTIPQFTLRGGFVAGGNVLKITVKDVKESDKVYDIEADKMNAECTDKTAQLYRLGDPETGLTVWETTLDLGLGEGNELEIVQFNDTHLNASDPKSFANWSACIEYAQDNADYFVLNGDIVDKFDPKLLGFVHDQLSIYDNCMTVLGSHEWTSNNTTIQENYDAIQQKYWKNDVYYSSTVLNNRVMLIQMDNSQKKFTADQRDWLTQELEKAKENDYAVLLFVHEPIGNNLTPETSGFEYSFYSVDYTDWRTVQKKFSNPAMMSIHSEDKNTAAVCQLIADNADIIKGVFAGHLHSDFYVEIVGADGTIIPQYVNGAAKFDTGNVLKINLK